MSESRGQGIVLKGSIAGSNQTENTDDEEWVVHQEKHLEPENDEDGYKQIPRV